jgi:CubicO group peptidase (beta-lactamase class C family)
MDRWLGAALDYIPQWIEFQMRYTEQPGCAVAIAHRGQVVLERAYGFAHAVRGVPLTPRHRFRVASHSKSFTAAGIMRLREKNKLRLDDPAGKYVGELHSAVAEATIAQLLSHTAGIIRDGHDTGQWVDRRPFRSEGELRADLREAPILAANTRFKYSNHGYGLLGLIIEAVTHEPYRRWIMREVVDAAGLTETWPDAPVPRGTPFARGHSGKLPLGHRVVIPGTNSTHALASATGFISTAGDLARFFGQLSPGARNSFLSHASRREISRRQWRVPQALERYYGLGTISGTLGDWEWFGHSGGFQGYITRTSTFPAQHLTVSVLTNAADGLSHFWQDGIVQILRRFAKDGAPTRRLADWNGRWWSLWGTIDLIATGKRLLAAMPVYFDPFIDASEIEIIGRDKGRVSWGAGFASHGQDIRRIRNARGRTTEIWLAGAKLLRESQVAKELSAKYEQPLRRTRR